MALNNSLNAAVAAIAMPMIMLGSACSNHSGGWVIEGKQDAMTGATVTSAMTTLHGENADLELTAYCRKDGEAYRFRTFDKDGQPLGLIINQDEQNPIKQMIIRVDEASPFTVYDSYQTYSNQFNIVTPRSRGLGKAQKIVVRVALAVETETFTIDQGDSAFRQMMKPCIQQFEAAKQRIASRNTQQAMPVAVPQAPATLAEDARVASGCWRPPSGPDVIDDPDRAISYQEVEEIERATGRSYQAGDSIYGRVEDRCGA